MNVAAQELKYIAQFLAKADADRLFAALSSLPWKQHIITMYGKKIPAPRLFQWMGIPPQAKSYSGGTPTATGSLYGEGIEPIAWTPEALEIQQRVCDVTGFLFDSLNINFYRDEKDYLGFHVDKANEGLWEFPIASVSLGAERDFQIRRYRIVNHHKRQQFGPIYTQRLAHGSLIVMPAQMQASWVHQVKRQTQASEPRVNLTFRMMTPATSNSISE